MLVSWIRFGGLRGLRRLCVGGSCRPCEDVPAGRPLHFAPDRRLPTPPAAPHPKRSPFPPPAHRWSLSEIDPSLFLLGIDVIASCSLPQHFGNRHINPHRRRTARGER